MATLRLLRNTTKEKQLQNLLEIPRDNFKIYILSANRRVKDILETSSLDVILEMDITSIMKINIFHIW